MVDLVRAEWLKIIRNVRLTTSLVWVFPIAAATILTVGIIVNMIEGEISGYMSLSRWPQDFIGIWAFINRFPANVFGRMLPLAFMATFFAGEFEWGTWKNVVPRSRRVKLVLAKLVALTGVILLTLALTSIVIVLFQWVGHQIIDLPYEPAFTMAAISEALGTYLVEALIAMLSLFLLASFAALAAFITRSVLGSLLLSFGFSVAELLSLGLLALFSLWFDRPKLVEAYRFMPSFNFENLRAWFVEGHSYVDIPFGVTIEAGAAESAVWIGLWIAVITFWAVSTFRRQDITT